jgi:hypothetical protein
MKVRGIDQNLHGSRTEYLVERGRHGREDLARRAGFAAGCLVNPKTLSRLLSSFMKTDRPLQLLSFFTL